MCCSHERGAQECLEFVRYLILGLLLGTGVVQGNFLRSCYASTIVFCFVVGDTPLHLQQVLSEIKFLVAIVV